MAMASEGRLRVSANPSNYSLDHLYPRIKQPITSAPPSMRRNYHLNHPDLSKGQKKYLWSICSAYSTAQMKRLVQDQYLKQCWYEAEKGILRVDDLYKYLRYIADPTKRKRQFQENPKMWRARSDQYNFRYHREHVINQPLPALPIYVENEIKALTRTISIPVQRRYVTKNRREKVKPKPETFPQSNREKHARFVLPPDNPKKKWN
uniref:uncharacterized protein LOC120348685 n=1 Tax=Styela clava TaxID=7725 RepID=UPI00193A1B5E|nr:uncharacterized protein LOC120348685 [Styela clava]